MKKEIEINLNFGVLN